MASLYEMAMGPQQSFYDDYQQVQQDKFANSFNQSKLAELARADQARPLMGRALQGDKSSLAALAGIDPGAYIDVGNYQSAQAKAQQEISDQEKSQIAGALYAADTPQKWEATINYLEKQGYAIDAEDRDFNNREAFLGAVQGIGGQLQQFNAETNRLNATKAQQAAGAPGKAPNGFRWTQDGNLEAIPGGPQDPNRPMPNRSLRPNNDQNNAAGFYDRMVEAEKVLSDPNVINAAVDYVGKAKANAPFGIGNYLATPEYQMFDQAQRNFVNAVLRKESGAAISEGEFANAAVQYFPQPGDSPEKIALKAQNRATAINAMKRTAAGALMQHQQQPSQPTYPGADGITPADQGGTFDNGAAPQVEIPQAAVEQLVADDSPEARAEFDAVFGQGAAEYVLGQ